MALTSDRYSPGKLNPGDKAYDNAEMLLAAFEGQRPVIETATKPAKARVLKLHMSGDDVKAWQEYLRSQGFTDIEADGDFGARTLAATRQMQKRLGVRVDGKVGDLTKGAMAKASAMPTPRMRPTLAGPDSGPPDNVGAPTIPGMADRTAMSPFAGWDHLNKPTLGPIDRQAWSQQFAVDEAAKAKAMAIRGGVDPSTSHSEALMPPDPAAGMSGDPRFAEPAAAISNPRLEALQRALMGKAMPVAKDMAKQALIRALMGQ